MPAFFPFTPVRWLGCAVLLLLTGQATADTWRVKIQGQGTDLGETPIVVPLKNAPPPGDYELRLPQGGSAVPAQVFVDAGTTYFATVLEHVRGNAPVTYALQPRATKSAAESVSLRRSGADIAFDVAGKPFLEERVADGPKPYYFPVHGPTGAMFTRAFPMQTVAGEDKDHFHQRSMWFTHGNVNGFDFWASDPLNKPSPKYGTIKETARTNALAGAAAGVLRTTDDWLDPDGKKVCQDERVLTVYNTGATRVLDFDITLKATAGPVTFGDTKEGMFGLRVASSMDVKNKNGGKITNAEGVTDDAAWGKASPWVDYTGPVEGETVGVAILNHPDSFRYPTTWHVRTYGLFAANPFGWHDFGMKKSGEYTLPAGEPIRFRYRVVLHRGDTASAHIPQAFEGYAKPPRVEVTAD
ncbi:MAG: PmoA family protein [Isosphaeraceae bacterium]|nr:PmoA family protein [Isosphaeraceae bacterium]